MSGRGTDSDGRGAGRGPSISAIPFRETSNGELAQLLGERERTLLARIASPARFARGTTIYREGDRAALVYNIAEGVVKAFRTLPNGTRRIVAFLFPGDLIGLAEEGFYVNQTEAVTAVAAYRLPLAALDDLARGDPSLDYDLILKLSHELREAQRHGLILARHDAVGKVAMFVHMIDRLQQARGRSGAAIHLPMSRSDIADYVGMSLAAVSRAFRTLVGRDIVEFSDRRHLQILDRARFDGLVLDDAARGTDGRSG